MRLCKVLFSLNNYQDESHMFLKRFELFDDEKCLILLVTAITNNISVKIRKVIRKW